MPHFPWKKIPLAASLLLMQFAVPVAVLRFHRPWLYYFDKNCMYYLLWALLVVFLFCLYRFAEEEFFLNFGRKFKEALPGLLFCAAVTLVVVSAVEAKFRVLSDETTHLGVSQKMYLDQEAVQCSEGEVIYGKLQCLTYSHELRNPFFAFLLTLTHAVLGFDSHNGFILNGILCFWLFWLLFLLCQRFFGPPTAVGAVFLLASYPIFTQNVASSGMEVANSLFVILSFYFLTRLYFSGARLHLELFVLSAAMAAAIRYETVLVVLAGAPVVIRYLSQQSDFRIREWAHYPLYFMVAEIHRLLFWGSSMQSGEVQTFALSYLLKNLPANFKFLLSWGKIYSVSPLTFYLALGGVVYTLWYLWRRPLAHRPLLLAVFLYFLMPFITVHIFYAGNFNININTRLLLLFLPFIAVLASLFLHRGVRSLRYANLLAGCIFLFMLTPANADYIHKGIYLPNEYRQIIAFFKAKQARQERALVFYHRADFFLYENISALRYTTLLREKELVAEYIEEGKYDQYYFVEGLDCRHTGPDEKTIIHEIYQKNLCQEIKEEFPMHEVKRFYMDDDFHVRIYQLDQEEIRRRAAAEREGEERGAPPANKGF